MTQSFPTRALVVLMVIVSCLLRSSFAGTQSKIKILAFACANTGYDNPNPLTSEQCGMIDKLLNASGIQCEWADSDKIIDRASLGEIVDGPGKANVGFGYEKARHPAAGSLATLISKHSPSVVLIQLSDSSYAQKGEVAQATKADLRRIVTRLRSAISHPKLIILTQVPYPIKPPPGDDTTTINERFDAIRSVVIETINQLPKDQITTVVVDPQTEVQRDARKFFSISRLGVVPSLNPAGIELVVSRTAEAVIRLALNK
jgi:hypothetical protein